MIFQHPARSHVTEAVSRLLESLPHCELSPRPLVPQAAWALREILARHYRQELSASELPALLVSEGVASNQPLPWRGWFNPAGDTLIRRPRSSDGLVGEQALVVAGIESKAKPLELSHAGVPIVFASFCSRGDRIVTASKDGMVKLWNGESGAALGSFSGVVAPAVVAVAPDCSSVVMAATEGPLTVFEFGTRKPRELEIRQPVTSSTYLGSSKLAIQSGASHGATPSLALWDLTADTRLDVSLSESSENTTPRASPDGTRFSLGASIYDGGSFERLATLYYRQVIPQYSGGSENVPCRRISFAVRNDPVAALCGLDLLVMRQSGHEIITRADTRSLGDSTRLHESLLAPAFGFDDTIVAASNGDGTAVLYSASSGEELAALCGPHQLMLDAFFTADNRFFIARYQDGRVRIWPMYPDIATLAAKALDTSYSTPLKGVEPRYGSWNAEHRSCRGY